MLTITKVNTFCLCNNEMTPYNRSCSRCKTVRYSLFHEFKRQQTFNLDSSSTWKHRVELTHDIMTQYNSTTGKSTMYGIVATRTERVIMLIDVIESGLAKEFLLNMRGDNAS